MKLLKRIQPRKLISTIRKGRKTRLIVAMLVIMIVVPLVTNTILQRQKEAKADSFFKFDEGYGTTSSINDSNGAVSAGNITGAVWKTDDLCFDGKCLYFDGDGDFVTFADSDNLDFAGSDSFSLMGWFRHKTISPIIDIDHEENDLSEYTSTVTDSGDLSVSSAAAMNGTSYGLQAVIDDTTVMYGENNLTTPSITGEVRFRFYFDPNSLTMSTGDGFYFVGLYNSSGQSIATIYISKATPYNFQAVLYLDSGNVWTGGNSSNSDAPHYFEIIVKRATGESTNDGRLELWIDGTLRNGDTVTGDNYTKFFDFDFVRIGPQSSLDAGTSGTIFYDEAEIFTGASQTILSKYETTGADGGYKVQMQNDGKITCGIDNDNSGFPSDYVTSASNYADNKWHHFACVKNGSSSLSLYLDAQSVGSDTSITSSTLANDDPFYIGIDGDGASNDYQGFIDEVKVYRSARTADEIKADFLHGSALSGSSASFGDSRSFLSEGLVGYWKMDESSWNNDCTATSVTDSSGNGNNGKSCPASTGPTGASAGKFSYAGSFDGGSTADDYISITQNSTINNLSKMTYSAWIYPTSIGEGGYGRIFHKVSTSINGLAFYTSTNNSLTFYHGWSTSTDGTAVWVTPNNSISLNQWNYVAVTYDKSSSDNDPSIYINGVKQSLTESNTPSGTPGDDSAANLFIGNSVGKDRTFDGKIDEARVYNRALSPNEISQLYNWAPGPIGYWKLDEGSGSTINDSSGNGITGTEKSGYADRFWTWTDGKYGKALTGTGDDGYYQLTNAVSLKGTSEFTIEAWVYPIALPGSGSRDYIYNETASDNSSSARAVLGIFNNVSCGTSAVFGSYVRHSTSTSIAICGTQTVQTNRWYHVALVFDSNTDNHFVYVDGVVDKKTTTTAGPIDTNNPLHLPSIGNWSDGGTQAWTGKIDELKIYNYARSGKQIIEDMNAGHPAPGSPVGSAIVEYDFDEGYGDTLHNTGTVESLANGDLAGSGTTCPTTGACPVWSTNGKFGKALEFDGVNDYVDGGSDASVDNIFAYGGTVSAWVKLDSYGESSFGRIYSKGSGSSHNTFSVCNNGTTCINSLYFYRYSTGDAAGGAWKAADNSITTGQWYNVVVTFDEQSVANDPSFYVNGVQVPTVEIATPVTGFVSDDGYNLWIGNRNNASGDRTFDGMIDEFKIYRSILTAEQVKQLYNQSATSVMGSLSNTSQLTGGSVASNSASAAYCVPGSSDPCSPPIGEWKFDEGSWNGISGEVKDYSGNENSLLSVNGTSVGSGKYGNAGVFDGTNDYLWKADPTNNTLEMESNDYTISAWIKVPSSNNQDLSFVYHGAGTNTSEGYWFWFYNTSNDLRLYISDGATRLFGNSNDSLNIEDGKWHYITAVADRSGNATFYLDGVYVGGNSISSFDGTDINSTENFTISSQSTPMNGSIDDVKIYNYARTPSQIAWDYNRGAPLAQYNFDECSGTALHDTAQKADKKTDGYNGIIVAGGAPNSDVGDCTISATTMWYNGRNGKYSSSLDFDGTDDYAYVADNSIFSFGDGSNDRPFSITAWVKIDDATNNEIVTKMDFTTGNEKREYALWTNGNDKLEIRLYDNVAGGYIIRYQNYSTFPEGSWHHVTATYDGSTNSTGLNLYIDGDIVDDFGTGGGNFYHLYDTDAPLMIGYYIATSGSRSQFHDGQIDDLQIFNYALTPEQVKTVYNQSSAVKF